jgi:23S rRNA (guanine745-N1)-methyltransferase
LEKYLSKESIILDAGCGPGYYSKMIYDKFPNIIGIDISKNAILCAAKLNNNVDYIVSSIFKTPLKDKTVDCVLNIFAPKPSTEFQRILKDDGIIVEVIPGKKHLFELKKELYEENAHENANNEKFEFSLKEEKEIKYQKILNQIEIQELLTMTPYFYKTKIEKIEKIKTLKEINMTFDFIIKIWKIYKLSRLYLHLLFFLMFFSFYAALQVASYLILSLFLH